MKKVVVLLSVCVAIFLLIQLIPYGRDHTNPAVVAEPAWDLPETRALAVRACFDCHSNETIWPWYSNVAPISWLVQRDVDEGREKLNFSEWRVYVEIEDGEDEEKEYEWDDIEEVIRSGEMPLPIYLVQHPEAKLSLAEKEQLIEGLLVSTGQK